MKIKQKPSGFLLVLFLLIACTALPTNAQTKKQLKKELQTIKAQKDSLATKVVKLEAASDTTKPAVKTTGSVEKRTQNYPVNASKPVVSKQNYPVQAKKQQTTPQSVAPQDNHPAPVRPEVLIEICWSESKRDFLRDSFKLIPVIISDSLLLCQDCKTRRYRIDPYAGVERLQWGQTPAEKKILPTTDGEITDMRYERRYPTDTKETLIIEVSWNDPEFRGATLTFFDTTGIDLQGEKTRLFMLDKVTMTLNKSTPTTVSYSAQEWAVIYPEKPKMLFLVYPIRVSQGNELAEPIPGRGLLQGGAAKSRKANVEPDGY